MVQRSNMGKQLTAGIRPMFGMKSAPAPRGAKPAPAPKGAAKPPKMKPRKGK